MAFSELLGTIFGILVLFVIIFLPELIYWVKVKHYTKTQYMTREQLQKTINSAVTNIVGEVEEKEEPSIFDSLFN